MSGKKIAGIILLVFLAILVGLGVGGFIWYQNSPLPTAIKLATALKDGDADTVMECIEPATASKIKTFMSFTKMTSQDLSGLLLALQSGREELNGNIESGFPSVEFAGYRQEGDDAYISVNVAMNGQSDRWDIHFVRISGEWYLSLKVPSLPSLPSLLP